MKMLFAGCMLSALAAAAQGAGAAAWGDVDKSQAINAVDLQIVIRAALGLPVGGFDTDLDNNGVTDARDVQLITNINLGRTTVPLAVRGSVLDIETGEPITCAAVVLEPENQPGTFFVAVTDLNGTYEFRNLPSGGYFIEVQSQRYERESAFAFLPTSTLATFGLQSRPVATVIGGAVSDEDEGSPLVGAAVQARVGGALVDETYSCADGTFELAIPESAAKGDGPIDVEVSVSSPNYESESTTVQAEPGEEVEQPVALAKAAIFPSSLAGLIVRTDDGEPIPGARVIINGPVNTSADADNDGIYLFPSLLEGNYSFRVSASAFRPRSGSKALASGELADEDFDLIPIPPESIDQSDLDRDGATTAIDIQLLVNALLGLGTLPNADQNGDGVVDASDLQAVIRATSGGDS